jgi:hypothetical protein
MPFTVARREVINLSKEISVMEELSGMVGCFGV